MHQFCVGALTTYILTLWTKIMNIVIFSYFLVHLQFKELFKKGAHIQVPGEALQALGAASSMVITVVGLKEGLGSLNVFHVPLQEWIYITLKREIMNTTSLPPVWACADWVCCSCLWELKHTVVSCISMELKYDHFIYQFIKLITEIKHQNWWNYKNMSLLHWCCVLKPLCFPILQVTWPKTMFDLLFFVIPCWEQVRYLGKVNEYSVNHQKHCFVNTSLHAKF